jgi:hypothetical protein
VIPRAVRRGAVALVMALAALAGCTDALDPDVTIDDGDQFPPATDSRTSDPPTFPLPTVTEP